MLTIQARLVTNQDQSRYLMLQESSGQILEAYAANEIISACAQYGVSAVLIPGELLSENFLNLRTGLAGEIVQKLATYNIKTAVVMDPGRLTGRYREFVMESNKGPMFRTFADAGEAETWLLC